ncbi:MAG: methyltransferase domain-containing protein [Chlorobi bacterium]|nr:methyltransferase domain-containing protein [Chlorobiota bacterium]
MKILESSPSRYDRGIRILSLGKLDKIYDHLASYIRQGQRVLDIGCGTGALTLRAANNKAIVKAIDINPGMLEIARQRAQKAGLEKNIEFSEKGVAELNDEPPEAFDVVMSGLCFSELSKDEIHYALNEILPKILKPGGLLLIADETRPENIFLRSLLWLLRLPLVIITYILTQTTTSAVRQLPEKVERAGFTIETVHQNTLGNFIELIAKKESDFQN